MRGRRHAGGVGLAPGSVESRPRPCPVVDPLPMPSFLAPRPSRAAAALVALCVAWVGLGCAQRRERPALVAPSPAPPAGTSAALGDEVVAWAGARATLARRGPASHPRSRLVLDGRDASGATTEFLVDTGTSRTLLSSRSPAARTSSAAGRPLLLSANQGVTSFHGHDARLPALDVGGLVARDLPVFLVDRDHSLHRPGNVLGMTWMADLHLTHDAGASSWTLERRPDGSAGRRGKGVRLEGPGFPVVSVVDERGSRAFALIDTGAPHSLVARGARAGRYRVVADDGTTLLTIDARTPAPWDGLAPRGRRLAVWIGLEDLERASFTIDFPAARWVFF